MKHIDLDLYPVVGNMNIGAVSSDFKMDQCDCAVFV